VRDFRHKNVSKLRQALQIQDWAEVIDSDDTNKAYNSFLNILKTNYDTYLPMKRRKYAPKQSWMSESLVRSCKYKNKLYKTYMKNPTPINKTTYRNYKNCLTRTLFSKAKIDFYHNKIKDAENNMKATWNVINNAIVRNNNKHSLKHSLPPQFKTNTSETITGSQNICTHFNTFFTNIGPQLASKIPDTTIDPCSFLSTSALDSFYLQPVTVKELIDTSNILLKKGKSAGYDDIDPGVLKTILHEISIPLLHIINLSFATGTFPDYLFKLFRFLNQEIPHHHQITDLYQSYIHGTYRFNKQNSCCNGKQ